MPNFESAFYVVAGNNKWSRHVELPEALKTAKVNTQDRNLNYYITVFLFKPGTTVDVKTNVLNCYCVTDFGSIQRCNPDSLSEKDIEDLKTLVGFTTYNNVNYLNKPKEKNIV